MKILKYISTKFGVCNTQILSFYHYTFYKHSILMQHRRIEA